MAFPQNFMDELIARNDIVDVVSSYVQLSRKGANLFGLCPFHSEKTGSFSVSPDKQIYYCFGCKRGGGVINFIMEEENLTFPDAVRFLAKRAGMEIPEEDGDQEAGRRRWNSIGKLPGFTTSSCSSRRAMPSGPILPNAKSPGKLPCASGWGPPPMPGMLC